MIARSRHVVPVAVMLVTSLTLAGCDTPSDQIFTPPIVAPVDIGGRLRVTLNLGPDVVRGFTPDGARILYRSQGLASFGPEWRVLSVPVDGGEVREEAGIYRAALRDSVAGMTFDAAGRTLTTWRWSRPLPQGLSGCGAPAPPGPTAIAIDVFRLDLADGLALSAIPTREVVTPTVTGGGTINQRIRILPAELEIRMFGVDPYGPAVDSQGAGTGYVSDGEVTWRIRLADPSVPRDSVAQGSFPALGPSGDLLAVAVPVGVDSTVDTTAVGLGLAVCVQETITVVASGWSIELHDLTAGTASVLGEGVEPRFDPAGGRVLVRRPDGLYWIDLGSGAAAFISGTEGAYSPAISPDGSLLAFSARNAGAGGHDVFLLRLN